jgi:tetratricopeptide (TPR) repeat protein
MPLCRALAACLLSLTFSVCTYGQTVTSTNPQESSSRTQPDQPPTPPDAPAPDWGSQTSPQPKSKAKKIANKLDPHCIDVIFHSCWSAPAAPTSKTLTEEEQKTQQAAKDVDVGFYYLNEKNYIAAESRLKEATELKPDIAPAYIGLGQAQQKLGKTADARKSYEAYLQLSPDGKDAEKVKKALAEMK